MSQERLAQLSSTSTRTIARIEADEVVPRQATLERICFALGVTPDFWLIIRGDSRSTQRIEMNRVRRSVVVA